MVALARTMLLLAFRKRTGGEEEEEKEEEEGDEDDDDDANPLALHSLHSTNPITHHNGHY